LIRYRTLIVIFFTIFFLVGCGISNKSDPNRSTFGNQANAMAAFEESVYAITTTRCTGCHDSGVGPQFAVNDVASAYEVSKGLVAFQNVPQSRLVIRMTDGHCGADCGSSGTEMINAIRYWWDNGEGGTGPADTLGGVSTFERLIPTNLPTGNQYASIQWDLGTISSHLGGVTFSIEIQDYSESAYRVRNPRIISNLSPVDVKDLKVLINGNYDPRDNLYTVVDERVEGNTDLLLSQDLMLILKANGPGDAISINFQLLD